MPLAPIKLHIKKKNKTTKQGNVSLFTFAENCSCGLHCLPALVYLLVWPINFTLLIYWTPICFHWCSSSFCYPSIVEHWCRNMYSIVDWLVEIFRTVPFLRKSSSWNIGISNPDKKSKQLKIRTFAVCCTDTFLYSLLCFAIHSGDEIHFISSILEEMKK